MAERRAAAEPAGELPRVPTLLLAGEADFRTPLEDANAVAARLGATPVVVPHTGHSVLGNDFSDCARNAVAAFFRDGTTPACPAGLEPVVAAGVRAPRSLREVPQARKYGGRVGRTLNAFSATLADALVVDARRRARRHHARGGRPRRQDHAPSRGIRAARLELVPGVRVTGTLPPNAATATLRISGRAAARGSLTITRTTGAVRGRLGGRRISAPPRAASVAPARGDWGGPPPARRSSPSPALRALPAAALTSVRAHRGSAERRELLPLALVRRQRDRARVRRAGAATTSPLRRSSSARAACSG